MIKGQALQTIYMRVDRQTEHPNSYTRSAGENYLALGKKRIQPAAQRSHPPHKNQPTGIFREIYTLLLKIDIFVEKDFATVLYASASEV